jgi:hypothetical protein
MMARHRKTKAKGLQQAEGFAEDKVNAAKQAEPGKDSQDNDNFKDNRDEKTNEAARWQTASFVLFALFLVSFGSAIYFAYNPEMVEAEEPVQSQGNVITGKVIENKTDVNKISDDEATEMVLSFVNENLMREGVTADHVSTEETEGLYVVRLNLSNRVIDTFLTTDGKTFFPSAVDLNEFEATMAAQEQQAEQEPEQSQTQAPTPTPVADMQKSDMPEVEVFVMSHCPYGTQIEKGIIPVMETLGDKADIQIKFVNYAMHGKTELDEQLNQYCIQKDFPDKFVDYLKCFLQEGDTQSCIAEIDIDEEVLSACIADTDTEYKVTELYNDRSTWRSGRFPQFNLHNDENNEYGIRGSPSLVINGKRVNSGRDSASLLSAVCSAFTQEPEECSTQLSSASPSPGFGFSTSGTASEAQCG